MEASSVIDLKENDFIAAGVFCKCYENPFQITECIKIPKPGSKANKRLKSDLSYYKKLHKRGLKLNFIADYLGRCDTSLGNGYRYDCVRDHDLKVSKTLEFYLNQPETDLEDLYSKLYELGCYLVKNRILISDLHFNNILIKVDTNGEISPVIVDGIGDRVMITALNIFPSLLESKIIRRWNRFARRQLDGNALVSLD